MDNQTLNQFKKQLLERQQLLLELDSLSENSSGRVELDQSRIGRLTRMAALQDQAMSQEVQRRRKLELVAIKAALKRIHVGDFGLCLECDKTIKIKRLELNASVCLCISCASQKE